MLSSLRSAGRVRPRRAVLRLLLSTLLALSVAGIVAPAAQADPPGGVNLPYLNHRYWVNADAAGLGIRYMEAWNDTYNADGGYKASVSSSCPAAYSCPSGTRHLTMQSPGHYYGDYSDVGLFKKWSRKLWFYPETIGGTQYIKFRLVVANYKTYAQYIVEGWLKKQP